MLVKIIREMQQQLSNNGFHWTFYYSFWFPLKRLSNILERRMNSLEVRYQLPGLLTVKGNRTIWQNYDWERGGEEWTLSLQWQQALVDEVMLKYIQPEKTILEVGPGGGKWTETLQKIAKRLILVDLSERCIELCKARFSRCSNIEFFVNDGKSLDFIPDETVDFIWSFDVFVHIAPRDTEHYIMEFARILRRGGCGIIHHPKEGGFPGMKRSSMTAKLFSELLQEHRLTLVGQFDSWGRHEQFGVRVYNDIISVFQK